MIFWKHFKAEEIRLKRYTDFLKLTNSLFCLFILMSFSWKVVIIRMTVLKVSPLFFFCKYPVWYHCTVCTILSSQRLNTLHNRSETCHGALARKDFLYLPFWSLHSYWKFWSQFQTCNIEYHYTGTKQKWEVIFSTQNLQRSWYPMARKIYTLYI